MLLTDPIRYLKGVGEKNAKKLESLGIFNIGDLVERFPFRYEDLSKITPIAQVYAGGSFAVRAKVKKKRLRPAFGRRTKILEALLEDASGAIGAVWFNQPYLENSLQDGQTYLFAGPATFYKSLQLQNPAWERESEKTLHIGRIVPIYPLRAGIYAKWLRGLIGQALRQIPKLQEFMPQEIIKKAGMISYDEALRDVHFPQTLETLKRARERLAFDELFAWELKILKHKRRLKKISAPKINFDEKLARDFVSSLPFKFTQSQKIAAWQIIKDIQKEHPANRLLSGDVGSGKTVVAALAALQTAANGYRVAYMAPTEILASQHFTTFTKLPLLNDYPIALLTSSRSLLYSGGVETRLKKNELKKILPEKKVSILFGTHALLQKDVKIPDLGLIIVDEQHRFGVRQRMALARPPARTGTPAGAEEPPLAPHFLSMTATPIPRTLALTLYGDLDISRISELPRGRKPVATIIVNPEDRKKIYAEIEGQLAQGRQAFVVCPLIDPSDSLGVKSATEEYEKIRREIFPRRKIGLLHGKMKAEEKQKTMRDFSERRLDVLVSTSVIEVGVDCPNATMIIIEGAERFGLAQLHQLRGRVGRNDIQSYCYLFSDSGNSKSNSRLAVLSKSHNGLELAEADLKLRGPGEIYGNLQSGYMNFKIADIFDSEALFKAREQAEIFLSKYDINRFPALKKQLEKTLPDEIHPE